MGDKVRRRAWQGAPRLDDRAVSEIIMAAAVDGVLVLDEHGAVRYCSRLAEELLGQPPGTLAGRRLGPELLMPGGAGELELCLPGGVERVLDVRVSTAVLDGECLKIAWIRDVTPHRRAERSLEAALGRQSAALAVAGHELRGPLAAIAVLAHALADGQMTLGPSDRAAVATRVANHAERLQLIVSRLLTSARIEAGATRPARKEVSVPAVIAAQLEAAGRAGTHAVTVTCPDDLAVLADPSDLAMMVGNYLDNALAYGRPPVAILAAAKAGMAQIEVSDGGSGVPDSFVPQLFERFTRAPGAGLCGEGIGLGLWIVRTLAQANDGDAWYERMPGGGSRFCLRLPLAGPPRA